MLSSRRATLTLLPEYVGLGSGGAICAGCWLDPTHTVRERMSLILEGAYIAEGNCFTCERCGK